MEKEERTVRQKLYEIRREKYSRAFYKSPERPKFVDVNVCETEEPDDSNKLNLITASGVARTKNSLRRKSIAVEELNPGQVVRVCVSSKLEDKVTGDETSTPSTSLPPIVKPAPSNKRRHSVAIVTNIEQHNISDLFTSVTSYMQSISEESEGANICKDDLYCGRKTEERYSEMTFGERSGRNDEQTGDLVKVTYCSEKLRDLRPQTTAEEVEEKNRNDRSSNTKKTHGCRQKALLEDYDSAGKVFTADVRKTETGQCNSSTSVSFSPARRVKSIRRPNSDFSSNLRPQSSISRNYSDSSLQERDSFRKCITPVPLLSKRHSRLRSAETSAAVYEGARHKRKLRSLSAGSENQASVLTEKEAQMAEQVIIRQLEIKEMAKRMKKLSLQHFGDSKTMPKIPRKQSSSNSPYTRRRLEDRASHDTSNSSEGVPTPEITRRHTHNPHLLKKIVKDHCKNDRGKTVMVKVLFELSGDMPDCRYLRCGDKASERKDRL